MMEEKTKAVINSPPHGGRSVFECAKCSYAQRNGNVLFCDVCMKKIVGNLLGENGQKR